MEAPQAPAQQFFGDMAPAIMEKLSLSKLTLASGACKSMQTTAAKDLVTEARQPTKATEPPRATLTHASKGSVQLEYFQMPRSSLSLRDVIKQTPKPKGKTEFSSIHIVTTGSSSVGETFVAQANDVENPFSVYHLAAQLDTPAQEYNAIFEIGSKLILNKADRASLLLFVSDDESNLDGFSALIGMLPFRGVSTALYTLREDYMDLEQLHFKTPSGVFEFDSGDCCRMGMCAVAAVYGPLPSRTFSTFISAWDPVPAHEGADSVILPFKIASMKLPMMTYTGAYADGVVTLAEKLMGYYAERSQDFFPVVSCGETCDALGYGSDVIEALEERGHAGYYYSHKSGETFKRPDTYGHPELLDQIKAAKDANKKVVIIAVGGGVNGNCTGQIAAMVAADFIEVPTTPMHYNDATTSAKKAFSLVVDNKILSKNILGAFYLPKLVYCINESLLTISSANAHATVGEATKTMNMLGIADSKVGIRDYSNIMGGREFASDFTKILSCVEGFESLIRFIQDERTLAAKQEIVDLGKRIAHRRQDRSVFAIQEVKEMCKQRRQLMHEFRALFADLPDADAVNEFMTTINVEIVKAKAMFLSESDPFEKYRALLFEYAHTLGHGVEAVMNGMYQRAEAQGIDCTNALRLHGQCVGMAVLWAGQMSSNLGVLEGRGLQLHQSFVYLFNRFGGFSFGPLRDLMDTLGVTKAEFVEGVLEVVRRDNKRGYTKCGCGKSVDQLVACRPGKMMRSDDPNAELRYLVEVDEKWQQDVLEMAFDREFDMVADLKEGQLEFKPQLEGRDTRSLEVAQSIKEGLVDMYIEAEKEKPVIQPVTRRTSRRPPQSVAVNTVAARAEVTTK